MKTPKPCPHKPGRWTKNGYANLRVVKFQSSRGKILAVGVECLKCHREWRFENVKEIEKEEWL